MTDFVRRIVSGNKARFRDGELDLDLDLVYITDQVIVMGFPAAGIEALYRNRREDAKRFLEHRHGRNFWVFNFCPVKENSYPASVFDGRVSRYPFPDHHAPPLAILALVSREMRVWLSASPDHVAVLHCKAGKGRSGTLACAYLLAMSTPSTPPTLERQRTIERATSRAEEVMNVMPRDEAQGEENGLDSSAPEGDPIKHELMNNGVARPTDVSGASDAKDTPPPASADASATLSAVLALHTARRMRPAGSASASATAKQGVSIPSQRRWLYYWALLLARQGPPDLWPADRAAARGMRRVRLTQVKLRMRELSGTKTTLVRAANALIGRALGSTDVNQRAGVTTKSRGQIWASLARYDDELVGELEGEERRTRDERGDFGVRRAGCEPDPAGVFKDGRWDREKMVRSFARLGALGDDAVQKRDTETDGRLVTLLLRPLTGDKWEAVRESIAQGQKTEAAVPKGVASEEASMYDGAQTPKSDGGVVLDANREVRLKLYMGQVFMGWFWFIPAFHIPRDRFADQQATLVLVRKELDFPLGVGSSIVDVEVSMEWYPEAADVGSPPSREESPEPAGFTATLQAVAAGDVSEAVHTKQAAED